MSELTLLLTSILNNPTYPNQEVYQVIRDPGGVSDRVAEAAGYEFFVDSKTVNIEAIEEVQRNCPGVKVTIVIDNGMPSYIDTPKGRIFFTCNR